MRRVGPVNRDEFFVAIIHGKFYPRPGLKFRRVKSVRHNFFKTASANVSKLFHQFGLVAILLLQLHG